MKYIIILLLLVLVPSAKSALTDGDFSHLKPEDVGLSKIDIISKDQDAALCLEYKIYKNGELKEHRFILQRQDPKNEIIIIYGTPIWGNKFIMKLAGWSDLDIGHYELSTMSRSNWKFEFSFKNAFKDTMKYLLVFSEVPLSEIKKNKHIPPSYNLSGSWGVAYSIDGEIEK